MADGQTACLFVCFLFYPNSSIAFNLYQGKDEGPAFARKDTERGDFNLYQGKDIGLGE